MTTQTEAEGTLAQQSAERGEPVAFFDNSGQLQGRVSKEQLVVLCYDALRQLGETCVPLKDYEELQSLVSSQGIRLMEYESQPLTDGQIDRVYVSCKFGSVMEFARAIEAAHGITKGNT